MKRAGGLDLFEPPANIFIGATKRNKWAEQMQTFKDSTGQPWDVRFTINQQIRIRSRCGISIPRLLTESVLKELHDDDEKLIDLVWAVVEDQATARSISADSFFERMDADTLEAAVDTIFDAAVEALPLKKQPAAEKILRILRQTGIQAIATATKTIQDLDEAKTINEISNAIAATLHQSRTKNTGLGFSNEWAKSDSTPEPGP